MDVFSVTRGIAIDADRGFVYLADSFTNKIKYVDFKTGKINDFVGSGKEGNSDGIGDQAEFNFPFGIAFNPFTNVLYVVDSYNNSIRKVDVSTRQVTTISSSSLEPSLNFPSGIAVDTFENKIYVTDTFNNLVRSFKPSSSTSGGEEEYIHEIVAPEETFLNPTGICFDSKTRLLFVADSGNHKIKVIRSSPQSAVGTGATSYEVNKIAGSNDGSFGFLDGNGDNEALFSYPTGITSLYDDFTEKVYVYVIDRDNRKIRQLTSGDDFKLPFPALSTTVTTLYDITDEQEIPIFLAAFFKSDPSNAQNITKSIFAPSGPFLNKLNLSSSFSIPVQIIDLNPSNYDSISFIPAPLPNASSPYVLPPPFSDDCRNGICFDNSPPLKTEDGFWASMVKGDMKFYSYIQKIVIGLTIFLLILLVVYVLMF